MNCFLPTPLRRIISGLALTALVAWASPALAQEPADGEDPAQQPPAEAPADEQPPMPLPEDDGPDMQAADEEADEGPAVTIRPEVPREDPLSGRSPEKVQKEDTLIQSVEGPEMELVLNAGMARLMRTRVPVSRISIANPNIVSVTQYGPQELELTGLQFGETTMTLWFGQQALRPNLRYLVRVGPRRTARYREETRVFYYEELERRINALFPNSSIQLIVAMNKLIVRGQARDQKEATEILQFLRSSPGAGTPGVDSPGFLGAAVDPSEGEAPLGTTQLIDMLEVPGVQNIMLKARIASVSRSALRQFGFAFDYQSTGLDVNVEVGTQPNITAVFDGGEVTALFEAFENNGTVKFLAEPNLVTISGASASFIAGGAFPVPTVVGLGGVGVANTSFRGIGTQVFFQPVLIDKDRIRLTVSTSFSEINSGLTVAGVPGTDNRAIQTIVDLREGQWLAIGGLIEDKMAGGKSRIPLVGNLPVLEYFFSTKNVTRDENEVVILVSPELVSPLDPENVPMLLPGMDVTEPTNWEFYAEGRYEGRQGVYHRSTIWPEYKHRMRDAMREARRKRSYHKVESHYISGDHGFSR